MPAPTPDTITLARQRYLEGAPLAAILAETNMSLGTLYLWLDGGPESEPRLPPLPRRRSVLKRRQHLAASRVSLIARLWRTAERQVRDIEDRVRLAVQEPEERERDARVLAITVKMLRDLSALQDGDEEEPAAHDDSPDSIDNFRRELARRIQGIIAVRNQSADNGTQSP